MSHKEEKRALISKLENGITQVENARTKILTYRETCLDSPEKLEIIDKILDKLDKIDQALRQTLVNIKGKLISKIDPKTEINWDQLEKDIQNYKL